jgi:hypothetical protein
MLLNIGIIKLIFITQNNHVYEHTAEGPTPEMLLNVRSPYRRQKRDLIIRSSFRRSYTGIEIFAINIITFLPTISTISYFPTFLRCDYIDYLTFLTITSTISYLSIFLLYYRLFFTFLRSHRLFSIFLLSCDRLLFTFLPSYLFPTILTISYFPTFLRLHRLSTTDIHIVDLSKTTYTRSANQNRARFAMPRYGKSSS